MVKQLAYRSPMYVPVGHEQRLLRSGDIHEITRAQPPETPRQAVESTHASVGSDRWTDKQPAQRRAAECCSG
jgi:hypothetical protein